MKLHSYHTGLINFIHVTQDSLTSFIWHRTHETSFISHRTHGTSFTPHRTHGTSFISHRTR